MSKHDEIAFTGDIARAVAEELGISKEMAMDHIDFLVHWIKYISRDPHNLNIQIPHIGYMYINVGKVQKAVDHFSTVPEEDMSTSWINQLEKQRVRLQEFNKQFPDLEGYNRHKKRTKIMNNWFNKGMSLQELEEWQNK